MGKEKMKVKDDSQVLFTIGYESRSIDEYLSILIEHNVKVLCDVRKNAQSRKYGFSKKTLNNACNALNIKYIHLPELGIESEKRKKLNTPSDYRELFSEYEIKVLQYQPVSLNIILEFLQNYHRVALTCFELHPKQCHRTRVAISIHKIVPNIPLIHL